MTQKRPTPIQAQTLDMFRQHLGLRILWTPRGAIWQGVGSFKAQREIGKPKISSLRALKRGGWIESESGDPSDFNIWKLSKAGRDILKEIDISPPNPQTKIQINAAHLIHWLRDQYPPPGWVVLEQVYVDHYHTHYIDAFAMRIDHEPKGMKAPTYWIGHRVAFEIKASIQDFKTEMGDPRKRAGGLAISNQFYFLTPPGLVLKSTIPSECGLIEADGSTWRTIVEAPHRQGEPANWSIVASMLRAASRI